MSDTITEWITVEEAARRLRVTRGRVSQLCNWGELESRKPHPRLRLVLASSVEAWRLARLAEIASGRRGTTHRHANAPLPGEAAAEAKGAARAQKRNEQRKQARAKGVAPPPLPPARQHAAACRCRLCRARDAKAARMS